MTTSKPTRKIAAPLSAAETELLKAIGEAGQYKADNFETCKTLIQKRLAAYLSWKGVYILTDAGRSRLEAILEGEHASHI